MSTTIERQRTTDTASGRTLRSQPGEPFPLGATTDARGTNFSIFSEVADRVELCLFDADGRETRVDLPERTAYCWHGFLRGIKGGQRYGFRVHGPWGPQGHRCNPAKLLVDPYARAITGDINYGTELCPDKYHGANASWG